jgi:hypothetical protein
MYRSSGIIYADEEFLYVEVALLGKWIDGIPQ